MQFLADMGVSGRVAQWLRDEGHDVSHLSERGLQRLPNGDIFQLAAQEQRVILTFDLDFGEVLAGSKNVIVSVVIFRLHNTRTDHVIGRLRSVLAESGAELTQGAIIIVEEGRHRIRRLPIGKQDNPA